MSQLLKLVEYTLEYIGEKDQEKIKVEAKDILERFKNDTQNKTEKEVKSWIDQWIAFFPSDVTSGGVPLQSAPELCFDKMVKYIKRTKHNKDLIFKATEAYLEERGLKAFAYTKAAHYFIDKRGEGSLLEMWCNKVKNQDDDLIEEDTENYDSVFI